jgi:hypothetical protein
MTVAEMIFMRLTASYAWKNHKTTEQCEITKYRASIEQRFGLEKEMDLSREQKAKRQHPPPPNPVTD